MNFLNPSYIKTIMIRIGVLFYKSVLLIYQTEFTCRIQFACPNFTLRMQEVENLSKTQYVPSKIADHFCFHE